MHERALVKSLLGQIDDELERRKLHRLCEVQLAIGEFAGIEPQLLSSAFEELAAIHWTQPVALTCRRIPLTARCQSCQHEFLVERFRFVCPHCEERRVDVIGGEELQLVGLRAEPISDQKGDLK